MTLVFWSIGVMLSLYMLHRMALAMEARGWIYYREKHPPAGSGAVSAMRMMEAFKPELEYVIEEATTGDLRTVDDETGKIDMPDT